MMFKQLLILSGLLISIDAVTYKKLTASCLCDVSSSCDNQCCCDTSCSSTAVSIWNTFNMCANDNLAIPLCSSLNNQIPHTHDLNSGLRTIYTVIKDLFCIYRINFVDPTSSYISSTSDSSVATALSTQQQSISIASPHLSSLSALTSFANLPTKNSIGNCYLTTPVLNLQSIQYEKCRILMANTASITSSAVLSVQEFIKNYPNIQVFSLRTPTSPSATALNSSNTTTSCTAASPSTCNNVIRFIKLIFSVSSSGAISLSPSSYITVGDMTFASQGYFQLTYSYVFMDSNGQLPSTSNQGYSIGSSLVFINEVITSSSSTYYKMINPINLAFRKPNGDCRTNESDLSSDSSLIRIQFGINSIFSCNGNVNLISTNLGQAFNYVGALGSSSNSLSDYVSLTGNQASQSVRLRFSYIKIGAAGNEQYKIVNAQTIPVLTVGNQASLFVEFNLVTTNIILNVPPAPKINAYLPNDFLYPFYVAS